jgi:hypothetical protein
VSDPTVLWSSPAWLKEATDWVDARLATAGARRTGQVEQPHLRPWATALRIPTTAGAVWLKAAAARTRFEVALYELLAREVPEHVLVPLAADVARGWVLLPDGGAPLGERVPAGGLEAALCEVLPQYAEVQRALAPSADAILALGAPDMRPQVMPERFEQALEATAGQAGRSDVHERLAARRDAVADWCARLAGSPGPISLDHNDLHAWNVLGAGTFRFYDWGDSVVAHPFASMLVPLTDVRNRVEERAALRLRDAYLEAWSDLAPRAQLVETLELAVRVGWIARSHTWLRAVGGATEERWATAPLESLAAILSPPWAPSRG